MTSRQTARPARAGPGRRAVLRWAWRLATRETHQQLLLVTLLSLACAISVGGVTAAHQLAGATDVADFGTATTVLDLTQTDERSLALDAAEARLQARPPAPATAMAGDGAYDPEVVR